MPAFSDFDTSAFWDDSDYALESYVSEAPTDSLISAIEQELGYKLPSAYIELMKLHNGGIPFNTCFPTTQATSWADDHIAISGILGIGRTKANSLCGEFGSQFMIEEWGYPDLGVCICDCPSAGHDMVMLDYSASGKTGEPTVVHVDQEDDYKITFLAQDFETFIRGLVNAEVYDTSAEDLVDDLAKVAHGSFAPILTTLVNGQSDLNYERIIRNICGKLTAAKGHFSLHADELSTLIYDVEFLLYSKHEPRVTVASYLEVYPSLLTFANGEFRTGGYAPSFITDWLNQRYAQGEILQDEAGCLRFSEAYELALKQQLKQYESLK